MMSQKSRGCVSLGCLKYALCVYNFIFLVRPKIMDLEGRITLRIVAVRLCPARPGSLDCPGEVGAGVDDAQPGVRGHHLAGRRHRGSLRPHRSPGLLRHRLRE